jgi:predicted nucleotidyltransferase
LAPLKLRDRDAIVTKEGLVFRVFGYSHPHESFVCDAEYASSKVLQSNNPKALRTGDGRVFYKFYEDEGWKFIQNYFPKYMIPHEMLSTKVVGVKRTDISEVKKPDLVLQLLMSKVPEDDLLDAMQEVVKVMLKSSALHAEGFGVFGSLLHGFYHPRFSDIDLIIYGRKNLAKLRETVAELSETDSSRLKNEFETDQAIVGKNWRFKNLSPKEYKWHQRRKLIYTLFDGQKSGRTVKTEFEPVKDWKEIKNEYDSATRVIQKGWTRLTAKVTDDSDGPFIPSVYAIEPLEVLEGPRSAIEAKRVISYLEEFRSQAYRGETAEVIGNLEEVKTPKGSYLQVVLTYCPRYYEQVLKVKN